MLNVLCITTACYFFYRHNKYCEPFGKTILINIVLIIQCRSHDFKATM